MTCTVHVAWDERLTDYHFGPGHPLAPVRLELTMRLARELEIADRVKFLGHRSDVAHLLDAADIYCQPNLEPDAFGISFIEALGARLPVITTALGGALEIVDQSCGALVKPNDPAALADALARLVDDAAERRRLGAAGPARARELCDPAAALRHLDDLVERLAEETVPT